MFRYLNRWLAAVAVACGAALALGGCGADSGGGLPSGDPLPSARAVTPSASTTLPTPALVASGPRNDIDLMFTTEMIPHHRQAVEVADLAATRAGDQRVKALAARIKKVQEPEIGLLSGWLVVWGQPVPPPDAGHMAHAPGMLMHADMEDLAGAAGTKFDRMFLEMMIRHHGGALNMTTVEQRDGANPTVKKLAADIEASQTAEITEMRALLAQM